MGVQVPPAAVDLQRTEILESIRKIGSFQALEKIYPMVCKLPGTAESRLACQIFAKEYRAQLSEWMTAGTPVKEIQDTGILLDKLVARYKADPTSSIEVAERLLDLEPRMAVAGEALVLARLAATLNSKGQADSLNKWKEANLALEKLRNMDVELPIRMAEFEMTMLMARNGSEGLKEKVGSLEDAYPDSGIGPYYSAWLESRSGSKERVMERLRISNGYSGGALPGKSLT